MEELVIIRNFHIDDVTAYVQLVNDIHKVDRRDKATSAELVKERLGQPGYHLGEDLFFAELGGLLAGYVDIVRELEIGRVVLDGGVHPAHRGRRVGSQLLGVALERSRELGAKVVHIRLGQRAAVAKNLIRKYGFHLVRRHWQMCLTRCGGEALQIPPRFKLSHFTPGDEKRLCDLQNLIFAGSWGFAPNSVEQIRYLVNTSCCHPEGILFLNEGLKHVGYCWTMEPSLDRETGCIQMMGVVPAYRGQGVGRLLLGAGIEYLRKRGVKEILLFVDTRNEPAVHLYRAAGFKRRETLLWYQKTLS